MKGLLKAHYVTLLLIAAAGVTTVIAYTTRESVTSGELGERKSNLFPVWREDEISRLEIIRPGERVVVERQTPADGGESTFLMTSPLKERAQTERVQKLLGSLGFATPLRRLDSKVEIGKPRWEIAVTMGKLDYRLRIGKEAQNPAGAAYVEVTSDGKPVSFAILSKDLVSELDVHADGLRDTRLVGYAASEVKELTLEQGSEAVRLSAAGNGRFQLEAPVMRADRDRVDLLFTELSRLDAERFLDMAQAEAAQKGADVAHLKLVPKQGAPVELWIGGSCPGAEGLHVVRRTSPSPTAVCTRASFIAKLQPTRKEFIDRFPFSLRPDEVEELRLERGADKLVLVRSGSGFSLRAPSEATVDLGAGNSRIQAIVRSEGEIVEQPDLKKLGLDPARSRATVSSGAEPDQTPITETISVGTPAADSSIHVRREADGVVLALSAEAARALVPDSTLLKRAQLFDFGPSSFVALEVSSAGTRQRLVRAPDGNLKLELPSNSELDGPLATDLVQTLGTLKVERWVADADDGRFGFEAPLFTAELSYKSGDGSVRTEKLSIGRSASGGAYAKLASDPGVFILGREELETLGALLLNRSVFMIDPKSVSAIELAAGGTHRELTRRGDEFTSAGLEPAKISTIVEALASLRAEAAISVGKPRPEEGFDKPLLVVRTRPSDSAAKPRTLRIGKGDAYRDSAIFYARADGSDATYVIAQSRIRPILDALAP